MNERDARRAAEQLAERIAQHAEPDVARRLTGGESSKVTSEQAHRKAAEIARQVEREKQERKS